MRAYILVIRLNDPTKTTGLPRNPSTPGADLRGAERAQPARPLVRPIAERDVLAANDPAFDAQELPRSNVTESAPNAHGLGGLAGALAGRNAPPIAAVLVGVTAIGAAGVAGAEVLAPVGDTALLPSAANNANYGAAPVDGAPVRVQNDHAAPVEIANEVLFGERAAPARIATLSDSIQAGNVLRPGAQGPEVAELQRRLTDVGFRAPVTSTYDADTVSAVRGFQRAYRISSDGNFGATSLEYLTAGERVTDPGRRGVGVAWNDGQRGERLELLYINGKPVSVETANALRPLFVAASKAPRPVRLEIVSGYRTFEEQRELRADYLAGRGNLAAPAGHSNHHSGIAVDLNTSDAGVYSWLRANGRDFGFIRTVPSERWHWEFRPDLAR